MTKWALIVLSGLIFSLAMPVKAVLVAGDSFDEATGSLAGDSGGAGTAGWLSSSWTLSNTADGAATVVAPGYAYSTLNTSGNALQLTYTAPFQSGTALPPVVASRNLGQTYGDSAKSVLWLSFLANSSNAFQGIWFGTPNLGGLGIENETGVSGGGVGWGTSLGGGTGVNASQLNFVLAELDFSAGGVEIQMWINPTPGLTSPAQLPFRQLDIATGSTFNFNQINVTTGVSTGETLSLDEIRVGTQLSDVMPIPEPSAFSYLVSSVFLVAGVIAFRRLTQTSRPFRT